MTRPCAAGWMALTYLLAFTATASASAAGFMLGQWAVLSCDTPLDIVSLANVSVSPTVDGWKIVQAWSEGAGSPTFTHEFAVGVSGVASAPITSRVYPWNIFQGLEYNVSARRRGLEVSSKQGFASALVHTDMLTSQGTFVVGEHHNFSALPSTHNNISYSVGSTLFGKITCLLTKTISHPGSNEPAPADSGVVGTAAGRHGCQAGVEAASAPIRPTLEVVTPLTSANHGAVNYNVPDAWGLQDPSLHETVFMLSLQGLANRQGPVLYLTYPDDWAFSYTPIVRRAWASSFNLTFSNVSSPADALTVPQLRSAASCFVVWDPAVRESLMVALTAGGVDGCLVVTEDLVPVATRAGLAMKTNFVGQFTGKSPVDIYSWSFDHYFANCDPHNVGGRGRT